MNKMLKIAALVGFTAGRDIDWFSANRPYAGGFHRRNTDCDASRVGQYIC